MKRRLTILALTTLAVVSVVLTAQAELIIEPVFNRVAGLGPAENNFPLYDPDFLIDGVA